MGDITDRARSVLSECDFVAAEDTRVGSKLLTLLGIKKPTVSFHEHTKNDECERLALRIAAGESCALITDAGTPAISDPGERLVAAAVSAGAEICALPGACAAVCAISASGLPSRRFCFEGFLPDPACERGERIEAVAREERTTVLYIAPHDAEKYLAELARSLGDRRCVLAKEITKLHERYFRGTVDSVCSEFKGLAEADKRGEYVLVIEGKSEDDRFWKDMTVPEHVAHYVSLGLSKMDACKQVSRDRNVGKGVIYNELINNE